MHFKEAIFNILWMKHFYQNSYHDDESSLIAISMINVGLDFQTLHLFWLSLSDAYHCPCTTNSLEDGDQIMMAMMKDNNDCVNEGDWNFSEVVRDGEGTQSVDLPWR